MDNVLEQMMLLKETTKTTGVLHQAQIEQLKYWPIVLIYANRFEITFDYEAKTVIYEIAEWDKNSKQAKNFNSLEAYIKVLLGKEYKTIVKEDVKVWHPRPKNGKKTKKRNNSSKASKRSSVKTSSRKLVSRKPKRSRAGSTRGMEKDR